MLKGTIKDKVVSAVNLIFQQIQSLFGKSVGSKNQKPAQYFYITIEEVIEFNKIVTSQAGLLRDRGGLESAIMRPQTAFHYEEADISKQTALLIDGIAMNHAFIDGNKRTALLAGVTFLELNGYKLRDSQNVIGKQIEKLVIGRDIELFTEWLRMHLKMP